LCSSEFTSNFRAKTELNLPGLIHPGVQDVLIIDQMSRLFRISRNSTRQFSRLSEWFSGDDAIVPNQPQIYRKNYRYSTAQFAGKLGAGDDFTDIYWRLDSRD
jgi:hypothetical protein